MPAIIDFSSFTTTERTDLLKAAKAELLRRAGVGSVQAGSGVGQSFQMMKMSDEALTGLINSLSPGLGFTPNTGGGRVRPNFSCRG
jgi:hypothetical protein